MTPVVLLVCISLHAETLDEIEKAVIEKRDSYKSVRYKQTSVLEMKNPNFSMVSSTITQIERVKLKDKWLSRTESDITHEQTIQEKAKKVQYKELVISDGEWRYSLSEADGRKEAKKSKLPKSQGKNSDKWVATLEKKCVLKVLPDATIEGESCFVIQGTEREDKSAISTWYYAKSCGLLLKFSTKNPRASSTISVTDLMLNPDIPVDRFKFKAPEGVDVQEIPSESE